MSMIQYIKVTSVHISILSGANTNNNFANFVDGGVLITSNASASTQAKATLAQVTNNPDVFSTELDIPVQGGSDLSAWLQGTQVNYIYAYNLRRPLTTTLHCKIHVVYEVNVQG